jgi:acyl-CoA thioester hydrolase
MFGHLNNAVYYQLFDSVINGWLINTAGINVLTAPYVGVVAESGCRFYREVGFPRPVTIGLRVMHLGRSSVTYQLGLFQTEIETAAAEPVAAVGHWVHVYIDRESRRSTPIPEQLRPALQTALTAAPGASSGSSIQGDGASGVGTSTTHPAERKPNTRR